MFKYYSHSHRLAARFKQKEIQDFVTGLRTVFEDYGKDPADLEGAIRGLLAKEIDVLHASHEMIRDEYDPGDRELGRLINIIHENLGGGRCQRRYMVRNVCNNVMPPEPRIRIIGDDGSPIRVEVKTSGREGRLCDFVQTESPVVKQYILNNEFVEGAWFQQVHGNWNKQKIKTRCPDCGSKTTFWSTANLLVPSRSNYVAMIIARLKSDGRRNSKLTEVICGQLRHLDDDYAFAVILKDAERLTGEPRRALKRRIKNALDRRYLTHLGIELPRRLSFNAALHYAVLCTIKDIVDWKSVSSRAEGLDDHVTKPQLIYGEKTVPEEWYGLRARAKYHGMPIEFQIKSEDVWRKEQDPNSALFHKSYAVKERERQMEEWSTAHWLIWRVLNETLVRSGEIDG